MPTISEQKTKFLLRIDTPLMERIRILAQKERRSINAQICFMLERALLAMKTKDALGAEDENLYKV